MSGTGTHHQEPIHEDLLIVLHEGEVAQLGLHPLPLQVVHAHLLLRIDLLPPAELTLAPQLF